MKFTKGYRNPSGASKFFTGRLGNLPPVDGDRYDPADHAAADALDNASRIAGASGYVQQDPSTVEGDGDTVPPNMPVDDGDDVPPEYLGAPFQQYAYTYINSGSSEDTPNQEALRNPYDSVVEVCEFRFSVATTLAEGAANYNSPAGVVGVSLSVGEDKITSGGGGIPLNLICPGQPLNAESVAYASTVFGTVDNISGSTSPSDAAYMSVHRLVLRTPLLLMPSELINLQFSLLGVLNSDVAIGVSYLGRVRPDLAIPKTRIVPYIACSLSPALTQTSATAPQIAQAPESDLQNPLDSALRINRFVGRINGFFYTTPAVGDATATVGQAAGFTEFTDSAVSGATQGATTYPGSDRIFVTMTKSTGTPTIPRSPFRLAFDAFTRAWEVDDMLIPGGFYRPTIELSPPDAGVSLATGSIFTAIAMHGERVESVGN